MRQSGTFFCMIRYKVTPKIIKGPKSTGSNAWLSHWTVLEYLIFRILLWKCRLLYIDIFTCKSMNTRSEYLLGIIETSTGLSKTFFPSSRHRHRLNLTECTCITVYDYSDLSNSSSIISTFGLCEFEGWMD